MRNAGICTGCGRAPHGGSQEAVGKLANDKTIGADNVCGELLELGLAPRTLTY